VLFAWVKTSPDDGTKELLGCGGSQNWTGYCQRLVTRDLDQSDRVLDPARQAQVLNRADRQIAKDVPYVPLFQHGIWSAVAPGVGGYRTYWYALVGAERWWLER
jgi:ABC-type transport system substrate-binding protein